MTGHISAPVRRILKGHSDRAFIHAVDDAGLEYKIEVPLAAVQDVGPGQRHVLVLSWSLQQVPAEVGAVNAQPSPPSPIRAAAPPSNAVDRVFMAFMAQPSSSTPNSSERASAARTTPEPDASQGLAELLGSTAPGGRRS